MGEKLGEFDARMNTSMTTSEQMLSAMGSDFTSKMQNQVQALDKKTSTAFQYFNTNLQKTKDRAHYPSFCVAWGPGQNTRSQSWKDYPNTRCRVATKSGWLKITIEGRFYGNNHG